MPPVRQTPSQLSFLQAAGSVSLVWLLVLPASAGLGVAALATGLHFAIEPLQWLVACVLPFLFLAHPPVTADGIVPLEQAVVDHPFAWTIAQWFALVTAVRYLAHLLPDRSSRRAAVFLIGLQMVGVAFIAWAHPYVLAKLRM
jgi:hypothetical protein